MTLASLQLRSCTRRYSPFCCPLTTRESRWLSTVQLGIGRTGHVLVPRLFHERGDDLESQVARSNGPVAHHLTSFVEKIRTFVCLIQVLKGSKREAVMYRVSTDFWDMPDPSGVSVSIIRVFTQAVMEPFSHPVHSTALIVSAFVADDCDDEIQTGCEKHRGREARSISSGEEKQAFSESSGMDGQCPPLQ